MAVDESFKRPGSVPFKWEISPGVPKSAPTRKSSTPQNPPPKLSLPPSGITFQPPPTHSGLLVRVPSRSKSGELRRLTRPSSPERRRLRTPRSSSVVATGCFPVPSPGRKFEKKMTVRHTTDDIHETPELQTLARWSESPRKSLSPFSDSSPSVSPFSDSSPSFSPFSRTSPSLSPFSRTSPSLSPFSRTSPSFSPFRMPLRSPRHDAEWAGYGLF